MSLGSPCFLSVCSLYQCALSEGTREHPGFAGAPDTPHGVRTPHARLKAGGDHFDRDSHHGSAAGTQPQTEWIYIMSVGAVSVRWSQTSGLILRAAGNFVPLHTSPLCDVSTVIMTHSANIDVN